MIPTSTSLCTRTNSKSIEIFIFKGSNIQLCYANKQHVAFVGRFFKCSTNFKHIVWDLNMVTRTPDLL
jgi:hypothetical protein